MYKFLCYLFILASLSLPAFGDLPALETYIQGFENADILGKAEILRDAASGKSLGESAGQLYEYALNYALENFENTGSYPDMNNIIRLSVNNLRAAGLNNCLDLMWKIFLNYPDAETRTEILIALGTLGKGNFDIIGSINDYLIETTSLFSSGFGVDYTLVSACITAIMELGDSSSYPALLSILYADYPEVIASEAYGALDLIRGNLRQFLAEIIMNNPPFEKFAAFKVGINSQRLSLSERGYLAELAIEQGLAAAGENADMAAMRYAAVLSLASLRWTRANALAIRHYYRVFTDYLQNAASKDRLIEAIACLGAVGNSDAALVLGLQLGLINSRVENSGSYDAEITLAIVQALGQIGDNAAFDNLLYIGNLSYTENIMSAAREAISRLKW